MNNFKLSFDENSKFNTVNLNKSNILKNKTNQKLIKKKYGNKISLLFSKHYNFLFEKSIKHKIYKTKKSEIELNKLSPTKIYFLIKNSFIIFINSIKIIKYFIIYNVLRKKINKKDIILFSSFDYHNNMAFTPIAEELEKKNINYYVLHASNDNNKLKIYKELYKNQNIINYYQFLHLEIFFCLFFNFLKKWNEYKNFIRFSFKNLKPNFSDFLKFEISYRIYLKILSKINPKSVIVKTVIGNEAFVAACKSKNIKTFGYAVQGVSLTNQSLTSQFLFNSLDNLFCYGKSDFLHFSNLEKKRVFDLPKKILISGSTRDYKFSKNLKKNLKKKKSIIYIRSSHIWFNNIDDKYLSMVAKVIKKNFQNKYDFKIKEKGSVVSQLSKNLILKNIIQKENLIVNNYHLTEDIISKSDIIMGTASTSILYQGLYFNKVIIQFGSKLFPWLKKTKNLGLVEPSNKIETKKILKLLMNNKKYLKIKKKQNKIARVLISKKNSASFIVKKMK